jgi:hypothetical protein
MAVPLWLAFISSLLGSVVVVLRKVRKQAITLDRSLEAQLLPEGSHAAKRTCIVLTDSVLKEELQR